MNLGIIDLLKSRGPKRFDDAYEDSRIKAGAQATKWPLSHRVVRCKCTTNNKRRRVRPSTRVSPQREGNSFDIIILHHTSYSPLPLVSG